MCNSGHFNAGVVVTYQPDGNDPEEFFGLYNPVTSLTRYIRANSFIEAKSFCHSGEKVLPQTFTLQPA